MLDGKDVFTGSGLDRMKIGIHDGSYPNVFSDIKFDVYYFNKPGQ